MAGGEYESGVFDVLRVVKAGLELISLCVNQERKIRVRTQYWSETVEMEGLESLRMLRHSRLNRLIRAPGRAEAPRMRGHSPSHCREKVRRRERNCWGS